MADETQSSDGAGSTPAKPGSGEPLPLEPLGSTAPAPVPASKPAVARPTLAEKPLLELAEHMPCPRCGAEMSVDGVVCMKCGYDRAAGGVRETAVGDPVEKPAEPSIPEFGAPGRLDSLALTIIGALLLAG